MWNAFESKLDWELHMTIVNSCNYPMSFQALQMLQDSCPMELWTFSTFGMWEMYRNVMSCHGPLWAVDLMKYAKLYGSIL